MAMALLGAVFLMIIRSFAPLGTPFIEHRVCNFSVSTVFLRSLALLGRSRACTKTGVDVSPVTILAQDDVRSTHLASGVVEKNASLIKISPKKLSPSNNYP